MTHQTTDWTKVVDSPVTQFLGAQAAARVVRTIGVAETLRGIANRVEADFRRWGDFEKKARIANLCPDGVIELMPISDGQTWTFKYVNGHPGNSRHNCPTVMAFGAIARVDNGQPVLLSEMTLTTALRTAAVSALAAKYLARADSFTMALVGNGAQSEFQALAFHFLCGIRTVRLYDRDLAASRKLVRNLRPFGIATEICDSALHACQGADIITTVTADTSHAEIITPAMVAPGMHINAVGGDSPGKTEISPVVLTQAAVFVEFEPQSRIEGEIQRQPADFAVTELWRVLQRLSPGRTSAREITVFDSVGFALEDFSALQFMCEAAGSLGLLVPIDLIPRLQNPKDLFSLVAAEAAADTADDDVAGVATATAVMGSS